MCQRHKLFGGNNRNRSGSDHAYDGNLLSNFEINHDDNWVGMDMVSLQNRYAVFTHSDNDICPGQMIHSCADGEDWNSLVIRWQKVIHCDDVPLNTLLWLRDYTRGNNERPFIVRKNGEIEWW